MHSRKTKGGHNTHPPYTAERELPKPTEVFEFNFSSNHSQYTKEGEATVQNSPAQTGLLKVPKIFHSPEMLKVVYFLANYRS